MAEKAAQSSTLKDPPSEHGGGFPPFQKDTFASQIVWLVLTFVLLYVLMSRIALPRVASIFEDRKQRIDGDLGEAQRLKDQSDAAAAAYEKSLADARSRAQSLANETRDREAAAAAAARKELDDKLNAKIAEAEKAISDRRATAMTKVQAIATEAASAIVERLSGTTPAGREVEAAVAAALKR